MQRRGYCIRLVSGHWVYEPARLLTGGCLMAGYSALLAARICVPGSRQFPIESRTVCIDAMAEEYLVNVTPQETRIAVIENGVLQELAVERTRSRGLVGNIYAGTVCRVLPGMGAAFLEIGLERTAFLHVSDIADAAQRATESGQEVPIESVVREGQSLIVQVAKDPLGTKGARLTTQISIPSRFLVLMPGIDTVGISQRIEDEEERQRLRDLLVKLRPGLRESESLADTTALPSAGAIGQCAGGFIVRTAADGISEDELARGHFRFST